MQLPILPEQPADGVLRLGEGMRVALGLPAARRRDQQPQQRKNSQQRQKTRTTVDHEGSELLFSWRKQRRSLAVLVPSASSQVRRDVETALGCPLAQNMAGAQTAAQPTMRDC